MRDGAGRPARVRVLPFDSAFFGFPVAVIEAPRPEAGELDAAVGACRSGGVRCAYLLVPADAPSSIEAAVRRGFRLVDFRVTLSAALPAASAAPAAGRDARPEDLSLLREMARALFVRSRFFVDARFGRTRAEDLFEAWLERDLAEGLVVVADREGRPAGFATARTADRGEAAIGLVGVAPRHRGTGVGRDAVGALLARLGGRADRVRVVTQAGNPAATALYERLGFRTVSVEAWLHWWSDENPV